MNPKKKSRRYRVSVSIHALDLAISRFTHSLAYTHLPCLSTAIEGDKVEFNIYWQVVLWVVDPFQLLQEAFLHQGR